MIRSTPEHRQRKSIAGQGASMTGGVNAKRQSAGDGDPDACERLGKVVRSFRSRWGRMSAADHGQLGPGKRLYITRHEQYGRGDR